MWGLGSPPYYKAHVEAFRALFDAVEDTKRFPDAGVPRGLIPLRVGSKAPTKGRGKDHPALGRGTLRRLCGSKGAVGVVPALLGAFVVDVDTDADSEDYAAASAAVAEFLGRVPHPPVFRNPTGKPGREHLWFRALPEEIEQGAWRYGEVRHNRGYLVVWDPEGLRAAVESERWDATQPVSPAALYALLPAAKASRKAAGRAGTTKEGSRGQAFRPFRLPTEMSVAGAATLLGLDKLRRNGEHHGPCVSCGKGGDTGDRCWLTEVRPHVVVLRNRDAVHADGCECDGEELRQEALSRLTGGKEVRQSSWEIAERVVGASALAYTAESEVWREWTGQSWDALGPLEVERRCSEIGERDGNHGPRVREAARCVPLLLPRNRVLTPGDWDVGWEERGVLPLAGGSGVRLSDGAIVGLEADWLLTLTAGVTREEYEARGDGDVWERLVQEWLPDAGERAAVQRLFGQGLLGNPAQRFVALVGPGGTGKSSFLSGLSVALGGVLGVIPPSFIAPEQRGEEPHPAALVPLERCRVVTSGEVSAAASWRESLVKDISGGDMVMVRGMREKPSVCPHAEPSGGVWEQGSGLPRRGDGAAQASCGGEL